MTTPPSAGSGQSASATSCRPAPRSAWPTCCSAPRWRSRPPPSSRRVDMSPSQQERTAAEPVWRPSEEWLDSANVSRLMRRHGLADLAALRARALDPEWLWPAVFEDLGIEFAEPFTSVLEADRGPEWATWFAGSRLNLADACLDRWAESKGHEEALVWDSERGERR